MKFSLGVLLFSFLVLISSDTVYACGPFHYIVEGKTELVDPLNEKSLTCSPGLVEGSRRVTGVIETRSTQRCMGAPRTVHLTVGEVVRKIERIDLVSGKIELRFEATTDPVAPAVTTLCNVPSDVTLPNSTHEEHSH